MKIIISTTLILTLSACATIDNNEEINTNAKVSFSNTNESQFKMSLSPTKGNLSRAQSICYSEWLINDECKKRGYKFFDTGNIDSLNTYGFCYKEQRKLGLNIMFFDGKENLGRTALVIESVGAKSPTSVKTKDVIIKINDEDVTNIGEIKNKIFSISQKNVKEVKLTIVRDGKTLTVQEPVIETDGVIQIGYQNLSTCLYYENKR